VAREVGATWPWAMMDGAEAFLPPAHCGTNPAGWETHFCWKSMVFYLFPEFVVLIWVGLI